MLRKAPLFVYGETVANVQSNLAKNLALLLRQNEIIPIGDRLDALRQSRQRAARLATANLPELGTCFCLAR